MTLPITAAIKYLKQDQPLNPGVDTTPEEYESYWHGIDEIESSLEEAVYPLFALDSVYPEIDRWFESGLGAVDKLYYEFFLPRVEPTVKELVGTVQNPGILPQIVLAGAARGNELIIKALLEILAGKAAKPTNLSVTWDITHHAALEFSKTYAYGLVKGINNTTASAFQGAMQSWITAGGKLPDLIDAIQGDLPKLDIPEGWSPGKIKWATSRDRARLIAQTESTRAFAEGSLIRWNQLGYSQARFRTQNDRVVCKICRKLHNVEGNSRDGWVLNGKAYFFPVHPGCRCFPSPIVKGIEGTPFKPKQVFVPGAGVTEALEPTKQELEKLYEGWGDQAKQIARAKLLKGSLLQDKSVAQKDAFSPKLPDNYQTTTTELLVTPTQSVYLAGIKNEKQVEVSSFNIILSPEKLKWLAGNTGTEPDFEQVVSQWMSHLESHAIASGIKQMELSVKGKHLTSGLALGYRTIATRLQITDQYNKIGSSAVLQSYVEQKRITQEEADRYHATMIQQPSLNDIYNIGNDQTWFENGEKTWIGKKLIEQHLGTFLLVKNLEKPPND